MNDDLDALDSTPDDEDKRSQFDNDVAAIEACHQMVESRDPLDEDSYDDLIPSGALVAVIYADPAGQGVAMQYACIGHGMNIYAYEGVLRQLTRAVEHDRIR